MVSARFVYGSTTTYDGSTKIHPGGATNVHDASTIQYCTSTIQAGSDTTSSSLCFRDESGSIGMNRGVGDTPIHPNPHEYTYGATKNEPDSSTVELRFRPRPQSTTIRSECFKRFKSVVSLSWSVPESPNSSRITTVVLRFTPMSLRFYYESCRCITI